MTLFPTGTSQTGTGCQHCILYSIRLLIENEAEYWISYLVPFFSNWSMPWHLVAVNINIGTTNKCKNTHKLLVIILVNKKGILLLRSKYFTSNFNLKENPFRLLEKSNDKMYVIVRWRSPYWLLGARFVTNKNIGFSDFSPPFGLV